MELVHLVSSAPLKINADFAPLFFTNSALIINFKMNVCLSKNKHCLARRPQPAHTAQLALVGPGRASAVIYALVQNGVTPVLRVGCYYMLYILYILFFK